MRILIAIGRSGGHIFPALSLADQLKKRLEASELLFIGTGDKLEKEILGDLDLTYRLNTIPVDPMPYRLSLRWVKFLFKLIWGLQRSWLILRRTRPDGVVGFGGAASGPLLLVAALMKIPTIIHEQNIRPSRSNRILSRFVKRVAVSFGESRKYFKRDDVILTGNPIRPEILSKGRTDSLKKLGLTDKRFTILVLGGSQGSHRLNELTLDAFSKMNEATRSRVQVIHLTGENDYQTVSDRYKNLNWRGAFFPFLSQMGDAYAACDLVVARAGATTIAEITALGLPAIFIPYPYARGHQKANASVVGEAGGALLVEESKLSATKLKELVIDLMGDERRLAKMAASSKRLGRADAAKMLADEVINLAKC